MHVLLIVPPFGPIEYPVLGPSLLKAILVQRGISCQVYYGSVDFAARIGFEFYWQIYSADAPMLIGERTFSRALFGDGVAPLERFWREVVLPFSKALFPNLHSQSVITNKLADGHAMAEIEALAFVDEVARCEMVQRSDVVGLSSSYGQNVAALAIAKQIKAHFPEKTIIMGGANCEGVMGQQLLDAFPFLDYVCRGSGDHVFPELLTQLEQGVVPQVEGILSQRPAARDNKAACAPPVHMENLPYPDFDDFFAAYQPYPESRRFIYSIPVEGSRGCWWGEKHHCIFCGINGQQMSFRRKSGDRFHREINDLTRKYGVPRIWATDNILDPRYFQDLIPLLKQEHAYEEMFFEIKSNLTYDQLMALRNAGITRLQPGIESLSTPILKLMKKGVTAIQNLQTLIWAHELGIRLQWNILCGFPSEDPAEYEKMAGLIPLIQHLPPPKACCQITIDRFSPLFNNPADYDLTISAAKAYGYVYDLPAEQVWNLAYFFSHENTLNSVDVPPYAASTFRQWKIWKSLHGRLRFEYRVLPDGDVLITDSRPVTVAPSNRLSALDGAIMQILHRGMPIRAIRETLGAMFECRDRSEDEIASRLVALSSLNYLYEEDGRYLCLATNAEQHVDRNEPCTIGSIEDELQLVSLQPPPGHRMTTFVVN